jgi:hypothetical protein
MVEVQLLSVDRSTCVPGNASIAYSSNMSLSLRHPDIPSSRARLDTVAIEQDAKEREQESKERQELEAEEQQEQETKEQVEQEAKEREN